MEGVPELPQNNPTEKPTERNIGVSARFTEAKTMASLQAQKAISMICLPDSDSQEKQDVVRISPKEVLVQLEALATNETVTTPEFISESERILRISKTLKGIIELSPSSDIRTDRAITIDSSYHYSHRPKKEAAGRLTIETQDKKGIKRIHQVLKSFFQEGGRPRQDQIVGKQQFVDQISEKEKLIFQKREGIMVKVAFEVSAAVSEYEKLLQEILEDGTIIKEIRDYYIQQNIIPKVDKITEEKHLSEAEKNAFLSEYRAYADSRKESGAQEHRGLEQMRPNHAVFNPAIDYDDPILDGSDKEAVQILVAEMAADTLSPLFSVVNKLSSPDGYRTTLPGSEILEKAVDPGGYKYGEKMPFRTDVFTKLGLSGYRRIGYDSHNYAIWKALKSSSAANELFGREIGIKDQEIYKSALEGTLENTGGGSSTITQFQVLCDNPTPEAIRNIVVLASSRAKNNYSIRANEALERLSKRSDWGNILDEAEKVYPSLETARQVLESWNHKGQEIHPDIQDAASNLLTFILNDKQVEPRLKELTTQALSNHLILDNLVKEGLINDSQAVNLKEAESFLNRASKETEQLRKSQDQEVARTPYVHVDSFKLNLRENLLNLRQTGLEKDKRKTAIRNIERLDTLSQAILGNRTDYKVISRLSDQCVINELQKESLKATDIKLFLEAARTIPALTINTYILTKFCEKPIDEERFRFFKNMSSAYCGGYEKNPTHDEWEKNSILITNLSTVIGLVDKSILSKERALELAGKMREEKYALSDPEFKLALQYPQLFLTTDPDIELFKKISKEYDGELKNSFKTVIHKISEGILSKERALEIPSKIKGARYTMSDQEFQQVLELRKTFLETDQDVKFCERLSGEFGKKADSLIKGYNLCVLDGSTITALDQDIVLEFVRQFRVITPNIIRGYKEAKEAGTENVFIVSLRSLAERMTGAGNITDEDRKNSYYKDLLKHVYPNNSGQWTTYENNESCIDRNSDLTEFKIKPRYEIDLLSQSDIKVKEGEALDVKVKEDVQKPIMEVAEKMNLLKHDKEKVKAALSADIDIAIGEIVQKGNFNGLNLESSSDEEKLFLILADSAYGSQTLGPNEVKKLIITYEFANFEDISDYIAGTNDRVSRASNQDYAFFCEVQTFYSDRIKEVNRKLVRAAWENPAISALMPQYFKKLGQKAMTAKREDLINRFQIEKLGASESFAKQVGRILEKRKGRKYELNEIQKIIRRYEGLTRGLSEKSSTSQSPTTRAFYGQLRSQREKTLEALKVITGQAPDTKIHLGEINLQQALDTETDIREGRYDEEQFASYTVQRFIDIFEDEKTAIGQELAKFESLTGKQREALYGYVTKSKESANARMVGGVCVAGDNPTKNPTQNMWDMQNYLQLVFQEPDTLQCQGLVLLHYFSEGGKKILTASLNPSSTYLYSVDEHALLKGILNALEQIASENQFDMILLSQNKTVRTNRTGGEFEKAIDEKVSQVNKTYNFPDLKHFSYNPVYRIQPMDVVWEKK